MRVNRKLLTLLLVVFVNILGAAMILPVLPLYALEEFGLTEQIVTPIISSYFVAQFLAGPLLGRLSDRHGRLPVLIASQIGTVISFVMMGATNNVWILLLARIIDGVTGGNIIVAQAYVTDITPRDRRTQALGYIMAVFGLGFIVGPALGGILSAEFGRRVPFYLAAAVAAITALMSWLLLDESLTSEQMQRNRQTISRSLSPQQVVRNLPLVQVLLISFIIQFGMGLVRAVFAFWGDDVIFAGLSDADVLRNIGYLFAVIGLTQFIVQSFFIRRLLTLLGDASMVVYGNWVRTAGTLVLALAKSPPAAYFASVLFPIGQGMMLPALQSLATQSVEDENRGGVLGVYQSALNLAIILGTGLGGTLYAIGPAVPFWIAMGLGLVAVLPAARLASGRLVESPQTESMLEGGLSE